MSTPASSAWHRCQRTDDIDDFGRLQGGWPLEFEMLAGGRFEGQLEYLQLPGARVVRESLNRALRQHGGMDARSCGFALALGLHGEARFSGQRLGVDAAMVGQADELDLCSPSGFELLGCVVDACLLEEVAEEVFQDQAPPWLRHRVVVGLSPLVHQQLTAAMRLALTQVAARPGLLDEPATLRLLRDDLVQRWINAMPQALDLRELKSVAARRRVVARACELMRSCPEEPLSMLALCRRIGASQRKLTYCFQESLGLSPARYLRLMRLHAVRRELRAAAPGQASVQDLAARWGFWHMGQFATDYRRQFGELPSSTLRQALA